MKNKLVAARAGLVLVLATACPAIATAAEGGNTQYGLGSSQFYSGAIPPFPGVYALSVTGYYFANQLNDGNGHKLPLDFSVKVSSQTVRLLGVTNTKFLGGTVWGQLVIPVVLNLDVDLGPLGDSRGGLSDIIVSGGLVWHDGPSTYIVGVDTALPTGSWHAGRLANPGLNHYSTQPTFGYGYVDHVNPTWEVAASLRYIVNFENPATNYTSGNELVLDYAAGYHFGPTRLGVVGYYLNQITDDKGRGVGSNGNRGRGFAIGPAVTYDFLPMTQLSVSYQKEVVAENRPKGGNIMMHLSFKF
ncbi:transporter (plasmid) [Roseomonas mucosa]|uniref:Phenol degradation protein meta n=1 Tax=Roseomonas mucosa TaxID=207340 RepID=A0A1S8CYL6_9PROT|nr:transporter [Roseomonas mucosa]ONH81153.1 hypothetical protein APZ41_021435 [Roseomonas mucosa]